MAYGRVSTTDKLFAKDGTRKDDASPEAQKQRCQYHVEQLTKTNRQGVKYTIVEHLSDEGFSGGNTNRPGYQKMWDLIASEQVSFIVAAELSRLSRSVADFLELVEHCQSHNVDIFLIGLNLDTTDPFGKVMLVILVALAQFEREMASHRVKENNFIRLIEDGKINGAAEIPGLIRNPDKNGDQFLVDEHGLKAAEAIMKLFVQFACKKKVLRMATQMGITGNHGKEIVRNTIDTILNNATWKYRGRWYANKQNKDVDPNLLPEKERYQIVDLPWGQIIPSDLLDKVEETMAEQAKKHVRSGKNYMYLLTSVLQFEDGSTFTGQWPKRKHRNYWNKKNRVRLYCDEIDKIIIDRVKSYMSGNTRYQEMITEFVKKKNSRITTVDTWLKQKDEALAKISKREADLREKLFDPSNRGRKGFMEWLEEQVSLTLEEKKRIEGEKEVLLRRKTKEQDQAGLKLLERSLEDFVENFDSLCRRRQKVYINRIFHKIVVKENGKEIELYIHGEPPSRTKLGGDGAEESLNKDQNGRLDRI